jgi:PEP-CTERM motif
LHTTANRSLSPPRGMRRAILLSILLPWSSMTGSIARAGIVTYDGLQVDIQESFGSGTNETMLVVDWKSGATPSYAWLYSWSDPATTMDDAIRQLAASEPSQLQYNAPQGFVVELNYFDGTEQHIGNTQGFMSIWDSPGTGDGPAFHLDGGVDTPLIAGGWAGIDAAGVNPPEFSYPGAPPVVPIAASVPEPGSLVLISLGLIGLAALGRQSQRTTGLAACQNEKIAS